MLKRNALETFQFASTFACDGLGWSEPTEEALRLFLHDTRVDRQDQDGKTVLMLACQEQRLIATRADRAERGQHDNGSRHFPCYKWRSYCI